MERKHNKSGLAHLTLLSFEHEIVLNWNKTLVGKAIPSLTGLISSTPCLLLPAADGRFTIEQRKVAYGYQIVSYTKFGRTALEAVSSSKTGSDLVLSHLCGTRNCCEATHLIIENKTTNDERTHCHWGLRNAKAKNGWTGVALFFESGACPHQPQCCSIN
jgi:hypothetical protein